MKASGVLFAIGMAILSACGQSSTESPSSPLSKLSHRRIQSLTSGGLFSFANASFAGSPNFVIDSQGNIFYPDTNNFRIGKIDTSGVETTFVGGLVDGNLDGTGTAAELSRPYQIVIDQQDNLFVADYGTFSVRKITPGADVTTHAMFQGPLPLKMAIDSQGNIYFSESLNWISTNTIGVISPAGVISTFAGSATAGFSDGIGTAATFNTPNDLAVDSNGNVYVSDVGNFAIRKISPAGAVTTFAGDGIQAVLDGTGTSAQFYFYGGLGYLAMGPNDTLYVGDMASPTGYIRTIDQLGQTNIFCGNGGPASSVDTGPTCADSGVWVNAGLALAPDGSIFFGVGTQIYKIVP